MQGCSKLKDEKYCHQCGKLIFAQSATCPCCGAQQVVGVLLFNRNKFIAALLAFWLGGFGAHKFYLGEVKIGLVYLLFCWTLIPFLIAFVEAFILLGMNDLEFAQKYKN